MAYWEIPAKAIMSKRRKDKKSKEDLRPLRSEKWRMYLEDPSSVPESNIECSCTKKKCERRYRCRECYDRHAAGRLLPYCLR